MKKQILEGQFKYYCTCLNLTIGESRHFGDEYIIAPKGTVYLSRSDARLGNLWGIVENTGDGCIRRLYGYVPADNLLGYMEGVIKAHVNEVQIIEAINSAEGRISTGTDIDQAFVWLREELQQIKEGRILYEPIAQD